MLTSVSNATKLDLSDDEKSNVGDYRSDDDAENSTNQRDNDEEELDPYILEKNILDDSDNDITEHHSGTDEALAQLIKMNQEARNSVQMEK